MRHFSGSHVMSHPAETPWSSRGSPEVVQKPSQGQYFQLSDPFRCGLYPEPCTIRCLQTLREFSRSHFLASSQWRLRVHKYVPSAPLTLTIFPIMSLDAHSDSPPLQFKGEIMDFDLGIEVDHRKR